MNRHRDFARPRSYVSKYITIGSNITLPLVAFIAIVKYSETSSSNFLFDEEEFPDGSK